MNERICNTCGVAKPATSEFFYPTHKGSDRLKRQCIECRSAWAKAYREANREKMRAQNRAAERRALDVEGTCEVDGCEAPIYRKPKPWCGAHYARWRKYGDPLGTFESKARNLVGQRFGLLVVVAQESTTALVECDCGLRKHVDSSNLFHGSIKSCGQHRRAEDVTYSGVHQRVKVDRGVASLHRCVDCGGQAMDWSYDRSDPDELVSPEGSPYSPSVDHYQPRCRSCHRTFDYEHDRMKGA